MCTIVTAVRATLVEIVLPGVLSVVGWFIVKLIREHLERARIRVTDDEDRQLLEIIDRAVLGIEERARVVGLSGTDKMLGALRLVADGVHDAKERGVRLPSLTDEQTAARVWARLPVIRASLASAPLVLHDTAQPPPQLLTRIRDAPHTGVGGRHGDT